MEIAQIYQKGRHYDYLFSNQMSPFWLEQATRYGGPILELGCGTGRIAIPLAQHGFTVTGLDAAPSMLAEARRKGTLAGVSITWQQADMREFDLGQTFALVLLPNNTLCHLLSLADFEACMACVRRHLQPQGRFIVEVFVPKLTLLLQAPEERRPFAEYGDPDGHGRIVVTETSTYDPATQIKQNRTYYKFPDRETEEVGTLPMRMYFPQELDALFKYNGFVIEHKYGGLDLQPFDAGASMQVFILGLR